MISWPKWLAAALCLLAPAALPAQRTGPTVEVPETEATIVVDGDLSDWPADHLTIELGAPEQVWSQKAGDAASKWHGPADLSARIQVVYDAGHLYVGGVVHDDDRVPGGHGRAWHRGDAIEVFLDLAGERTAASGRLDGDVVQLFLMPFSDERRFGQMDWSAAAAAVSPDPPEPLPTGAALTGIEARFRGTAPGTYTFEAVLPFHNHPRIAGQRQIGFQLALDDHDAARPGRYQYMTWTGENPTEGLEHFGTLRFAGVLPLSDAPPPSGGIAAWVTENASHVVLPLGGMVLLVALLWAWSALGRRAPGFRPVGRILGIGMFVLGLALPVWLSESRAQRDAERLAGIVEDLIGRMEPMERTLLGSYRGSDRDRTLVELLGGEVVLREQRFEYTAHAQLAETGPTLGVGVQRFPDLGFNVRAYGIPLPLGGNEVFHFATPIPPGKLNVVVARSLAPPTFPAVDVPVELELTQLWRDEPNRSERLTIEGPFGSVEDPEFERLEVGVQTMTVERPIEALSIGCRAGHDVRLVGLTWIDARDPQRQMPLFLGLDTRGGVPTDLRGPWPRSAGFELRQREGTEEERVKELILDPARTAGSRKLWLIYHGLYRSRLGDPVGVGSTVCEVTVEFDTPGVAPLVIPFRHQESMFFEQDRYNRERPDGDEVAVAFRWEAEDGEVRLDFVREIDLPAGAEPRSLRFRNLGPYPVRFRSAVFGRAVEPAETYEENAPLVRTDAGGQRLKPEILERFQGAQFALFRSDRLSASTFDANERPERTELPIGARRARLVDGPWFRPAFEQNGALLHEAYRAMPGEAWSGAVLGVYLEDTGYRAFVQWINRIGAVLCLGALPGLLLMFGDVLSVLSNLRFRLVSVLAVATLIPFLVLAIVLVRVLEKDHEIRLQTDMRAAASAFGKDLDAEKARLFDSARSWLEDLVEQVNDRSLLRGGENRLENARTRLQGIMERQIPPTWEGSGYLLFEFDPVPDQTELEPFNVFAGGKELEALDTPLRAEPGIYVVWGTPLLGVRCSRDLPGIGTCALSVGRRMDGRFLESAGRGHGVLLCDVRGYPLGVAGGAEVHPAALARHARQPATFHERERLRTELMDSSQPVVRRHSDGLHRWVAAYAVLRDVLENPRMIVGIVDSDSAATLPLALGRVPVRSFFVSIAGLVLLLSMFLGFVVTARISRPIDRLERGAQALRRGDFDVRVEESERGQIGRLTRSFNEMAADLRARIQDLRLLNRGISDLTARLELPDVIAGSIAFYARHSPADAVRLLLLDADRLRVDVHGGEEPPFDAESPEARTLLAAVGPFSMRLTEARHGALASAFPGARSLLGFPLALAGRTRGAVLLLFESARPSPVNLDLLATMAAQTSTAIENARLYRHAVEDVYTGALRPEFFARRLAEHVARAEVEGRSLMLAGLVLDNGAEIGSALGSARAGHLLEACAAALRAELGRDALVCRAAEAELRFVVPSADRDRAQAAIERVQAVLREREIVVPRRLRPLALRWAHSRFPEEAASAEFLIDVLEARLAGGASVRPAKSRREPGPGIVVHSPAMERVVRMLERVAPSDISVLLLGETGTGKEILADLIHRWSRRAAGPIVKVHCAALSESLLQSELFGHEKGAFTGAESRKLGRFEQAQGGTIFLDEIGEVSLDVQVKLLRVLQEREIDRVGGTAPVPVDVRVIAATNRDIEAMVEEGRFREDLYYRLQGMMVRVPPLRERRQEIPLLVEQFRQEAVESGQTTVRGFSAEAMDELFRRSWPGNVRELRNTVLRAMVMARGERVTRRDLLGVADEEAVAPAVVSREPVPSEPAAAEVGPRRESPERPEVLLPDGALEGQLSGRLRLVLELVARRSEITTADFAREAAVSERTALRDLRWLTEQGVLVRVGKRRGARYRLAKSR